MSDTEFLQKLHRLRTDKALFVEIYSQYVDLGFQCFELNSMDEGWGNAGLCLVDATLDLEPEKIALLLLFRLMLHEEYLDLYDPLNPGFNFPSWTKEISRYLAPQDFNPHTTSGSVWDRILRRIRSVSTTLKSSNSSVRKQILRTIDNMQFSDHPLYPHKKCLNENFSVRVLGQDSPTDQFDRSLLDGPFSYTRTLREDWDVEAYFFKSPRYWGLYEWTVSC